MENAAISAPPIGANGRDGTGTKLEDGGGLGENVPPTFPSPWFVCTEDAVSESMVEGVARAMCRAEGYSPEIGPESGLRPNWMYYLEQARAAIEAMRTPTKAMIAEGNMSLGTGSADDTWDAMIDAALSEAPQDGRMP